MTGLLSGVLPAVYSASNKLKRSVNTLLSDPREWLERQAQTVATDARNARGLLSAAVDEDLAGQAQGKGLLSFGPANQRAANALADAYNPMGMIVYHGSPHKFAKFDASKIGTGEGAQAYGHGLYLAESPDVAKSYQTALSMDRGFNFGGKSGLTRDQIHELANQKFGGKYLDGVSKPSGVADRVIDDIVYGGNGGLPRQYKPGTERAKAYEELKAQITHTDPGSLYKVDLPDDTIAKMLDWDKPLNQQPASVRSKAEPMLREGIEVKPYEGGWGSLDAGVDQGSLATLRYRNGNLIGSFPKSEIADVGALRGSVLLKALGGGNVEAASAAQRLRALGIPGVRYLDQGSRGVGTGTSNFVVFPGEEGLLSILERNGQPLR